MAAKIMPFLLCLLLLFNCSGPAPRTIDGEAQLDPEKIYIVEYWDAEPPQALDPLGQYRGLVEKMAAEFTTINPGIEVRIRWLKWVEAEDLLAQALREGNPPDLYGDWWGLARRDHVLQVPAQWLKEELLTAAGIGLTSHGGEIWAWPRWLWPMGLLSFETTLSLESEELLHWVENPLSWQELGDWLAARGLHLEVNDWEAEFTSQALRAASGAGWGQWGGQELSQVFGGLSYLVENKLVKEGADYLAAKENNSLLGGGAPAMLTWLAAEYPQEKIVLLPLPSAGPVAHIPVSGTNLLQFRQLRYKGDEHCRAAAMAAEYLARAQGQLAKQYWAISAWVEPLPQGGDLPSWYELYLEKAALLGIPARGVDATGRRREQELRLQAGDLLKKFWAGLISPAELASAFEDLQ